MEKCFSCAVKGECSELYVKKPTDNCGPYFPIFERFNPPSISNSISSEGTVKVCKLCKIYLYSQWESFESHNVPESRRMYFTKRHDSGIYNGSECFPALSDNGSQKSNSFKETSSKVYSSKQVLSTSGNKYESTEDSSDNTKLTEFHICCFVCGQPCLKCNSKTAYSSQVLENKEYFPFFEKLDPPPLSINLVNGATKICVQCEANLLKQWDDYDKNHTDQKSRIYHITYDHASPFSISNPGRFIANSKHTNQVFNYLKSKNSSMKCALCLNKIMDSFVVTWNQSRGNSLFIPNIRNFTFNSDGIIVDCSSQEAIICDVCHYFLTCQLQNYESNMVPLHTREYRIPKKGQLPSLLPPSASSTVANNASSKQSSFYQPSLPPPLPPPPISQSSSSLLNTKKSSSINFGSSLSAFQPAEVKREKTINSPNTMLNLHHNKTTYPDLSNNKSRFYPSTSSSSSSSSMSSLFQGAFVINCHICSQEIRDTTILKFLRSEYHLNTPQQPYFPFLKSIRENVIGKSNVDYPVCNYCFHNMLGQWQLYETNNTIPPKDRLYKYPEFLCTLCHAVISQKSAITISGDKVVCVNCYSTNSEDYTAKENKMTSQLRQVPSSMTFTTPPLLTNNEHSSAFTVKSRATVTVPPIANELIGQPPAGHSSESLKNNQLYHTNNTTNQLSSTPTGTNQSLMNKSSNNINNSSPPNNDQFTNQQHFYQQQLINNSHKFNNNNKSTKKPAVAAVAPSQRQSTPIMPTSVDPALIWQQQQLEARMKYFPNSATPLLSQTNGASSAASSLQNNSSVEQLAALANMHPALLNHYTALANNGTNLQQFQQSLIQQSMGSASSSSSTTASLYKHPLSTPNGINNNNSNSTGKSVYNMSSPQSAAFTNNSLMDTFPYNSLKPNVNLRTNTSTNNNNNTNNNPFISWQQNQHNNTSSTNNNNNAQAAHLLNQYKMNSHQLNQNHLPTSTNSSNPSANAYYNHQSDLYSAMAANSNIKEQDMDMLLSMLYYKQFCQGNNDPASLPTPNNRSSNTASNAANSAAWQQYQMEELAKQYWYMLYQAMLPSMGQSDNSSLQQQQMLQMVTSLMMSQPQQQHHHTATHNIIPPSQASLFNHSNTTQSVPNKTTNNVSQWMMNNFPSNEHSSRLSHPNPPVNPHPAQQNNSNHLLSSSSTTNGYNSDLMKYYDFLKSCGGTLPSAPHGNTLISPSNANKSFTSTLQQPFQPPQQLHHQPQHHQQQSLNNDDNETHTYHPTSSASHESIANTNIKKRPVSSENCTETYRTTCPVPSKRNIESSQQNNNPILPFIPPTSVSSSYETIRKPPNDTCNEVLDLSQSSAHNNSTNESINNTDLSAMSLVSVKPRLSSYAIDSLTESVPINLINSSYSHDDNTKNEPIFQIEKGIFKKILTDLNVANLIDLIDPGTISFCEGKSSKCRTKPPSVYQMSCMLASISRCMASVKNDNPDNNSTCTKHINYCTRSKTNYANELGLRVKRPDEYKTENVNQLFNQIIHLKSNKQKLYCKRIIRYWSKHTKRHLKKRLLLTDQSHLRRSLLRPILSSVCGRVKFQRVFDKHEPVNLRCIIRILNNYA